MAKLQDVDARGDLNSRRKASPENRKVLRQGFGRKNAEKEAYIAELQEDDDDDDDDDEEEEEEEGQEIRKIQSGKRPASKCDCSIRKAKKGKNVKGPLDFPEASMNSGKANSQTSVNGCRDEEAWARTIQCIAQCFYRNGIPFDVVNSSSFWSMIKAVGNYGPCLKVPSYHELRGPLLKMELNETKEMLKGQTEEWGKSGCSIMVDAWTDKKNRTLINFLVNCASGNMLVKCVDASSHVKTGVKLFQLLDSFVEEIGEKNAVQVVTESGSNYALAGKLLETKWNNLFWTPSATHCVDLMLEDIRKLPWVKRTIQRGITLVSFIYSHKLALNMMRKFTKKMELVRHGVTRNATSYLALQRLHKQKNNLRKMFTSDQWSKSKLAKEAKGKRATDIVLMPTFWNDVVYSLKAMLPLVYVFRIGCQQIPTMDYIYEAMDKAKKAIQKAFNENENKCKDIIYIIDKRWEPLVHHPLHAAGHFLNPEAYYSNPENEYDEKLAKGLYKSIERLCETKEEALKILTELPAYKDAKGSFGTEEAIEERTFGPAVWWSRHGTSAPSLQKFAIRVLNLTCSSLRCVRSWTTFVDIHSKKRSKLERQMLQDLVFVKCNQELKERFNIIPLDTILSDDVDDGNEWLVGKMDGDGGAEEKLVLNDDTSTRGVAADVIRAGESLKHSGHKVKLKKDTSRPSSSRGKEPVLDEDFKDLDTEEEEEEEIYAYSSGESGGEKENMVEDIEEDDYSD